MSIKRALEVFEKFAQVKCQVCGDFDEYADPSNPYCYKHFDSNKAKKVENKKEEDVSEDDGFENLVNIMLKRRIGQKPLKPIKLLDFIIEFKEVPANTSLLECKEFAASIYAKDDIKQEHAINRLISGCKSTSWAQYFKNHHSLGYLPKREFGKMIRDLS